MPSSSTSLARLSALLLPLLVLLFISSPLLISGFEFDLADGADGGRALGALQRFAGGGSFADGTAGDKPLIVGPEDNAGFIGQIGGQRRLIQPPPLKRSGGRPFRMNGEEADAWGWARMLRRNGAGRW